MFNGLLLYRLSIALVINRLTFDLIQIKFFFCKNESTDCWVAIWFFVGGQKKSLFFGLGHGVFFFSLSFLDDTSAYVC